MTAPPTTAHAPFSVLVVCTANICRSPVAEAHLRAALPVDADVVVRSAGLRARVGHPVAPGMAALLDVPLDAFAAAQVTPEAVRSADLVLAMTRDQRAAVVGAVPGAVRSTFTLREFADLVQLAEQAGAVPPTGPGERLAALVRLAPRYRALRTSGPDDDIDDPYGQAAPAYAHALDALRGSVAVVAAALTR